MVSKNDGNILQHLLRLETEASSLVDDAQSEADHRLVEAEKEQRIIFEQSYAAEAEKFQAVFLEETAQVRDNYKRQLDIYRKELEELPADREAFSKLARRLLLEDN